MAMEAFLVAFVTEIWGTPYTNITYNMYIDAIYSLKNHRHRKIYRCMYISIGIKVKE